MYTGKTFTAITAMLKISVTPIFLAEESSLADSHFVWAYHVNIENMGEHDVQLLSRYWCIINDNGDIQEVRGDGVIGKQPIIEPKHTFQYSSGTFLNTPSGMMMGSYDMVVIKTGQKFTVDIPTFSLDSPFIEPILM